MYRLIDFFQDPLLRAPTIGSMLMCLVASLIGVLVFVRKKSLLGETLSHAAYPGLLLGGFVLSYFASTPDEHLLPLLLLFSFFFLLLAFFVLKILRSSFRVKNDAALCFVLSSFFGVGVLLASAMQNTKPLWYKQIQTFLYGQTATLTDEYIVFYGILCLAVIIFFCLFYRFIELVYFDRLFAKQVGVPSRFFEASFILFLSLAILIAMKSVGIVLLSGMLIAPALTARRLSHKLSIILLLAGFIGVFSGFLGNYLSVKLSECFWEKRLIFPTGPMIVLVSSFFCFVTLLFSYRRKKFPFLKEYQQESLLKFFAHFKEKKTLRQIAVYQQKSVLGTYIQLIDLLKRGFVRKEKGGYLLSLEGEKYLIQVLLQHEQKKREYL